MYFRFLKNNPGTNKTIEEDPVGFTAPDDQLDKLLFNQPRRC